MKQNEDWWKDQDGNPDDFSKWPLGAAMATIGRITVPGAATVLGDAPPSIKLP